MGLGTGRRPRPIGAGVGLLGAIATDASLPQTVAAAETWLLLRTTSVVVQIAALVGFGVHALAVVRQVRSAAERPAAGAFVLPAVGIAHDATARSLPTVGIMGRF